MKTSCCEVCDRNPTCGTDCGSCEPSVEELIERSSLGTAEARALRALRDSVPEDVVRWVLARADELDEERKAIVEEAARKIRVLEDNAHVIVAALVARMGGSVRLSDHEVMCGFDLEIEQTRHPEGGITFHTAPRRKP